MWEGGINIAAEVTRRADPNVPRREGGLQTPGRVAFPGAGKAPGYQPRRRALAGRGGADTPCAPLQPPGRVSG
jgi:hypothetical protein